MSTSPEDAAALFDLPPPEAAAPSDAEAEDALAAAEAALAAEFAGTIAADGVATDAPDSRTDLRVQVSWPARMRLPQGRLVALTVRDVSGRGVGLASDEPIPTHALVDFEMDVPPPDATGPATTVKGKLKTTYTVAHGSRILGGGVWMQAAAGDLELVNAWIRRPGR